MPDCTSNMIALVLAAGMLSPVPAFAVPGGQECVEDRINQFGFGHSQRPAAAAPFTFTPLRGFTASEIGQAVGVTPAFEAEFIVPAIIILRVAAHVYHRVNR